MHNQGGAGEMVESTRAVVAAARAQGLEVGPILARFALTEAVLHDPDQRLQDFDTHALWAALTEASGDPDLVYRGVAHSPFGGYMVLDYLVASCSTLGQGVRAVARYIHVVHPALRLTIESTAAPWRVRAFAAQWQSCAFTLATVLQRLAHLVGPLVPLEVSLRGPPFADLSLAHRLFGPHLRWFADEDTFTLDDAAWQRAVPAADPTLHRIMARMAELEGPARSALEVRVAQAIDQMLPSGEVDIEHIAARLGLTTRTLQRRLNDEGTHFAKVLDQVRHQRALEHLADRTLPLVEVALLLGYADETAFHRAFRRWQAVSPGQWRRGQRIQTP